MPDKKISELNSLLEAAAQDLIPLVDVDQDETKNIRKDRLMGSPGAIGQYTPGTGQFTTLQVTTGATVDEISTDVTFATAANDQLATALAIKTYVDAQIGGTPIHNNLLQLQGGDSTAGEYYHLTQSIHDGLFSASPTIGLGSSSGTNLQVDYGTDVVSIEIAGGGNSFTFDTNGLTLELGTNINEFSIDGTMAGNSDDAVPTEKAVKTYVDNIQSLDTINGSEPIISGDSTGTIIFEVPQVDTQYSVVGNLVNEVQITPSIYGHIITEKTTTGFIVLFSGPIDSSNYEFDWVVSRAALESSSSSSSKSSSSSSSSSTSSSSASVAAQTLLEINDGGDTLEINDGGDVLVVDPSP